MTAGVLNPALYARLLAIRGAVHIPDGTRGRPTQVCYTPDPQRGPGAQQMIVVAWGESYVCSCLFCRDGRQRMSVNHLFGTYDRVTGRQHDNTWRCYNSDCQKDYANRQQLLQWLTLDTLNPMGYGEAVAAQAAPAAPADPDAPLPEQALPGTCVHLTDLPKTHPANLYLASRRFAPARLVLDWDVMFCVTVPPRSPAGLAQGRIIIPVVNNGVRVGWQARYPDDLDWRAVGLTKYVHYFPTGRALYGLDQLGDAEVVPLYEGVTDVWAWGPGALGRFGKGLGHWQARLLAEKARGRTLLLVPDGNDPEAPGKCVAGARHLARAGFEGRVGICLLPPGADPAKLGRPTLAALQDAAARAAVPVAPAAPPPPPATNGPMRFYEA